MPPIFYARSSIKISLHPAARDAYEFLECYPKLISWNSLPQLLTNALLREPLRGVMLYEACSPRSTKKIATEFQFFAPLWPARHWQSNRPPEDTILIDDEKIRDSIEQIETAAWLSVLQLLVFSVNANSLATLRENFQDLLPPTVSKKLFDKKKVTYAELCRWAKVSRGTLIQQRKRDLIDTNHEVVDTMSFLARNWGPSSDDAL